MPRLLSALGSCRTSGCRFPRPIRRLVSLPHALLCSVRCGFARNEGNAPGAFRMNEQHAEGVLQLGCREQALQACRSHHDAVLGRCPRCYTFNSRHGPLPCVAHQTLKAFHTIAWGKATRGSACACRRPRCVGARCAIGRGKRHPCLRHVAGEMSPGMFRSRSRAAR